MGNPTTGGQIATGRLESAAFDSTGCSWEQTNEESMGEMWGESIFVFIYLDFRDSKSFESRLLWMMILTQSICTPASGLSESQTVTTSCESQDPGKEGGAWNKENDIGSEGGAWGSEGRG